MVLTRIGPRIATVEGESVNAQEGRKPRVVVVSAFPGLPIGPEREALADCEVEAVHCPDEATFIAAARTADAVIVRGLRLTAPMIEALERCRVIAAGGIGVDYIDVDAATERGIVVTNVPDVFVEEVANHAWLLILACAKKLVPLHQCVVENRWREARSVMRPMPRVTGDTLGLVAFGNIARAVARRAHAFGMRILAYDPYVPAEVMAAYGVAPVALDDLFALSDFVSCHVPLTRQTYHLIGEAQFRRMKPTAYFINTSRGAVVDEAALIRALREGWLAGAGLDVFEKEPPDPDNPLLHMPNVVCTPHSASVSDWANVERWRRVGQEVAAVLAGRRPKAVVNPAVLERVHLAV
jgi:D-3-phosphoglycerate dehydrogenase